MKVICTRNNTEFELVSKDGDGITLKDLNSGKERIVNRKSYERFYKEVEEEVVEEVEDLEEEETEEEVDEEASEDFEEEEVEDADEDAVEDCEEEDEEFEEEPEPVKPVKRGTKKAEAKKEPKPKKVKEPKAPRQISPLKDVVETIVKAAGCTIFVTRVKGFHTIKLDGHMCMAFTFSTKGIVLWLRTKALDGLNIEYKTMKHMFDARISLTEDKEKTANLIRKCVAASVEYQKGVNTRKAQKAEALEAARQKKLEKEEQKKKEAIAEKLGVKPKKAEKKASKKVETPEVEAEALEDEEE